MTTSKIVSLTSNIIVQKGGHLGTILKEFWDDVGVIFDQFWEFSGFQRGSGAVWGPLGSRVRSLIEINDSLNPPRAPFLTQIPVFYR